MKLTEEYLPLPVWKVVMAYKPSVFRMFTDRELAETHMNALRALGYEVLAVPWEYRWNGIAWTSE